ncbi:periostin-like [Ornithodoros turicata]|uniref:periostin-like n=1 Tax=Ornithodoros turicata TaxID=34597 RepID=UPI00313944FD
MTRSLLGYLLFPWIVGFVGACGHSRSWYDVAKLQGPGVCPVEVISKDRFPIATPWTKGKFCGSMTYVRMVCCQGYNRSSASGDTGCSLVQGKMEDIATSLATADLGKYLSAMKRGALLDVLRQNKKALTVLAAPRTAVLLESDSNQHGAGEENGVHPLLYTVIEERLPFRHLQEKTRLVTAFRNDIIKVHKFKSGLVTANCVPFVSSDLECTNGVVHVTERLLKPPQYDSTADYVRRHPRLTTLFNALEKVGMINDLGRPQDDDGASWNTMWAPVDTAWENLPENLNQSLFGDPRTLKDLLKRHMSEQPWCATAVHEPEEVLTRSGDTIKVSCSGSTVSVEGAAILEGDILTRNGFVHLVDKVFLPHTARSVVDILQQYNLTTFLSIMDRSGLLHAFQNHRGFTIFAPENSAFEALGENVSLDLKQEPHSARSFLTRHVVTSTLLGSSFAAGQLVETLDRRTFFRVQLHRKGIVTVGGAVIKSPDHVALNGVVHVLDKTIQFPEKSVVNFLEGQQRFGLFMNLINASGLLSMLDKELGDSSWTIFALPDESFPDGFVERLLEDPQLLNRMIEGYVVPGYIITAGMPPLLVHHYKAIFGQITLRKEDSGEVTVSKASNLVEQDYLCTNGVVHVLSDVLPLYQGDF